MIQLKKYKHYDQDLERAILGVCMLEKSAFARTVEIINETMFYDNGHKKVYEILTNMYSRSIPIDLYIVTNEVMQKGVKLISNIDTPGYLTALTNNVVSSAHLEAHCLIVRELWRRREVLKIKYSSLEDDDSKDTIERMQKQIQSLNENATTGEWMSIDELIYNLMVQQSKYARGDIRYTTTGLEKLDKINNGFSGGDLVILAARPAVGKSAYLGMMALSMARKKNKVGIISLEMSNNQIAARLSSLDTDISFKKIYTDIANDEALHKRFYERVQTSLTKLPIYITDKTKVSVLDIKAKAQTLKYKHGIDVLFIDYLQLIDGTSSNRNYNREQEVSQMSRGLKMLAKDLDIPIIALCQLNRESEKRTGEHRFPRLSDLRESGAIEQDADVVMFLHRDYVSGIQVDPLTGDSTIYDADLIIAKWRNGETVKIALDFEPEKMKFEEKKETEKWIKVNELTGNPF